MSELTRKSGPSTTATRLPLRESRSRNASSTVTTNNKREPNGLGLSSTGSKPKSPRSMSARVRRSMYRANGTTANGKTKRVTSALHPNCPWQPCNSLTRGSKRLKTRNRRDRPRLLPSHRVMRHNPPSKRLPHQLNTKPKSRHIRHNRNTRKRHNNPTCPSDENQGHLHTPWPSTSL